jgi:hypothetical protein
MTGMSLVVDMEHTRDMDITLNIDKAMIIIADYCWNYTSLWILRVTYFGIYPQDRRHRENSASPRSAVVQ